jgi:hypothetical protein
VFRITRYFFEIVCNWYSRDSTPRIENEQTRELCVIC